MLMHCTLLRSIEQNRPVCWSIVVKKKPTVRSPLFETFPFDRNPKATKDVNVISVFTVEIPINYTSEFLEFFEATTY